MDIAKLEAYEDPDNPGNQPEYHTGRPCCEPGCPNVAGTAWSPHWCFECNVKRIKRISQQLETLTQNKADEAAIAEGKQ